MTNYLLKPDMAQTRDVRGYSTASAVVWRIANDAANCVSALSGLL